jgi:hypothetical protein
MPDQTIESPATPKFIPGEMIPVKEQLESVSASPMSMAKPEDPFVKAKRLICKNYNESRDKDRVPALTPELVSIIWFSGSQNNWKAVGQSHLVHGIRFEVAYNRQHAQAFIDVYRKINSVKEANA